MNKPSTPEAAALIAAECDAIKAMLLEKNAAYGNSALDPLRIFSQGSPAEQIRVRIDDKLSRLARGHVFGDEDTILDLIGYLVLLRVAVRAGAPPIGEEPCEESSDVLVATTVEGRALDKIANLHGIIRRLVPSRLPSGGVTAESDTELRARLREHLRNNTEITTKAGES